MLFLFAFLTELLLLFFLSQTLTRRLSFSLYRITRSKKFTVYFLAFLFFPGTLIHELAHFFMALILFVRVGEINLFPKLEGDHVRMGSVQVAKSDPIRRFFIGVSPIIIGSLLIFFFLNIIVHDTLILYSIKVNQVSLSMKGLLMYFLFAISNTMFSSKKDIEGVIELLGVIFVIVILAFVLGFRIPEDKIFTAQTISFLKTCNLLLLIPIGIDAGIIGLFKLLTK